MKYTILNPTKLATHQKFSRSGALGEIDSTVTVEELTELFGQPNRDNVDGKTEYEWLIEFEDGQVASIYDYKGDKWHIGGFNPNVVTRIKKLIGGGR